MTLKCAIIDDEPLARGLLESYVRKTSFLTLTGTYASAVEAAGALEAAPADLLLLDIQMPELSGLEFSRLVRRETRIIFTTAFDRYALESYRVNALDYLLKPIGYPEFLAAAQKALDWFRLQRAAAADTAAPTAGTPDALPAGSGAQPADRNAQPACPNAQPADTAPADSFFVKSDYKLVRVRFDDILYVEGLKDYVKIYLASQPKPLLSLTSMHSVEHSLPRPPFQRIHRSFIVNMERVSILERGQIIFGEKRLPVSDSYKDAVQAYVNRRLLQGR